MVVYQLLTMSDCLLLSAFARLLGNKNRTPYRPPVGGHGKAPSRRLCRGTTR